MKIKSSKTCDIRLASDVALSVRGVRKKFCRNLRRSMAYGIKDLACNLAGIKQNTTQIRKHEFWALDDISFDLKKGETLGIIGPNGSGKSTLLRVVNGIFPPDAGYVAMRGRVGALIALGAGFHPHLTGRENIFLNGTILGMSQRSIRQKLDAIIDFAEIGPFIDSPVSTYSSGMKVRLGFSVAVNMDTDILLVDEVLAVGDATFRERCYRLITSFKDRGGSVLFISHAMQAVESACDRVVWLEHGRIAKQGDVLEMVQNYEAEMMRRSHASEMRMKASEATPQSDITIRDFRIGAHDKADAQNIAFGQDFRVEFICDAHSDITPHFVVALRKYGQREYAVMLVTLWDGVEYPRNMRGQMVSCVVKDPNLAPGIYDVDVGVLASTTGRLGRKWLLPLRHQGSFTIEPDALREIYTGISSSQIVSHIPPTILSHEWNVTTKTMVL